MIKEITTDVNVAAWNKLAAHPMQSWQWGEARRKMGIEVLRIGQYNGTKLEHVFQMTLHPVPYTGYKIGYLPRSFFPNPEAVDYLVDFGTKRGVISIKMEPNVQVSAAETPRLVKYVEEDSRVVTSPAPLFPEWTQTIDLSKTEEELLKQMKPKTRYNARLAEKKGVTVHEMTSDAGFETFIKLYFETTKRQHYHGHNESYHRTVFNELKAGGISHILIAEYEGTPLAAYELFLFNNVLYYPYGGSSLEHKEVMAPNMIMWKAIQFGKKHGATSFDLWGSLPSDYDSNHMWAGFTRFKEGYGAEFTQMIGSFDIVIRPLMYKAFTAAQKIRERLL